MMINAANTFVNIFFLLKKHFHHFFFHSIFWLIHSTTTKQTNKQFNSIKSNSLEMLTKCLDYLKLPATQNGIYCRGEIRTKEAHCYTWDSSIGNSIQKISQQGKKKILHFFQSIGPIQIGIPPETIKTSLLQGESVPKVYILPSDLFLDGRILGEIGNEPEKKKKKKPKQKKCKKNLFIPFHSIPFHTQPANEQNFRSISTFL